MQAISLFLALTAIATASPIALSSTSSPTLSFNGTYSLEKRDNWGWVGAYNDATCTVGWSTVVGRPEIHDDCVAFDPVGSAYVGINWGTGWDGTNCLNFFHDDKCKNGLKLFKAPPHHQAKGAQSCLAIHKATIGSYRAC